MNKYYSKVMNYLNEKPNNYNYNSSTIDGLTKIVKACDNNKSLYVADYMLTVLFRNPIDKINSIDFLNDGEYSTKSIIDFQNIIYDLTNM